MSPNSNIIVFVFRMDLRVSDQAVFHHLSTVAGHGFTHLLPVYCFPPNQVEVSGFVSDGTESPYPEARSSVSRYFRCGPYRAKFLAESVWALKETLEDLQSSLLIRVGMAKDVIEHLHGGLKAHNHHIGAVWVASHEGVEEKRDERYLAAFCEAQGIKFRSWTDEKYFIDDRDLGFESPEELPDIFTTYRKSAEPLHEKPRAVLPTPARASLPPFPDHASIPDQKPPFQIPRTLVELVDVLVKPVKDFLPNRPPFPDGAQSAHPFLGGEAAAQERVHRFIKSESVAHYKDTRNGLAGTECTTKLSAYLAQGCVTSRQIHHALRGYEDGTDERFKEVDGFWAGENEGTQAIRFELLWRGGAYARVGDKAGDGRYGCGRGGDEGDTGRE
ncbi:DNA photolyase [Podospora australis]|uniref:DNA photolyase n=1 Tax=Podospora australis TaxID=1536484 RepID=A0AAN6X324_9PEZI|nr:DNA photolyase [Podospora australis]